MDNLPGIHQRIGVEEQLHLTHGVIELVAEDDAVELASREAVAMLAGVGAAEFANQIADLLCDRAHCCQLPGLRQIHEWADVQAPDGAMTVEARHQAVPLEHRAETLHILS